MFWGRLLILFFIYLSTVLECISQPVAGFTFSPTACRNETIQLTNTSTQATRYTWDFCHHDLISSPAILQDFTLPVTGSNFYNSIKLVFDNGVWTGFVTDAAAQKLFRLDYGDNINATPIVNDLGNLGVLTSPGPVDLVKEGGIWYVFIANIFQNKILRMTLGNGIRSAPTLIDDNVVNGSTPIGIRLVDSGALNYLVVSYLSSNSVTVYDFGGSFSGVPVSSSTTTNSLFVEVWGVDVILDGTNWYGMVVSAGNTKVLRLNFGSSLLNIPTVDDIGNIPTPSQVKLVKEGLDFVGFVRSRDNGIYRVIFGNTLLQTPIVERLSTSLLQGESRSLEVIKQSPGWNVLTFEARTGQLHKLDFVGNCQSEMSINNSLAIEPSNLTYGASSDYYIELSAFNESNRMDIMGRMLTVSANVAPTIDIAVDDSRCLDVTNTFQVSASKALVSYAWDFNDSFSGISNPATHTYSVAGTYAVKVEVLDVDGCQNFTQKIIKIYDPPVSIFSVPSGLICTNNQFTFANNTVDNFDGNLTYQWYIDNAPIATTRDLNYAFPTTGNKDVKLKTSIPGCFSEQTQTVTNVLPGPAVGFTIFGKCENENILFTNNSSGSITGYIWNFGNSQTSTLLNPTQNYSKGNYTVSLEATAPNGCISSIAKNDFSIGLPPFSCAGSASQFTDLTPALTDSNIATWTWGFGDAAEGSSSVKNPSYTYATASTYNVSLAVATNFGCTNSVQKAVTISPSPVAGFSNRPACVNQATQFTDASSGSIKSRLWQIQSSTFTTPNPQFIFPFAGSFPVVLTVTGNNNCVSQASKNIVVPVVPSLDFSVQAPCANSPTFFTELTTSVDPSISKSWSFGSQGTGSGSPVQYTFSSTSTYAVQLNSTRQSGCVYSVSKNVSIVSPPVADFVPSIDAGAAPLPVSFTNNSSGANSYLWKFGDQGNSTSVLVSPTFVFSELGAYNVELSASNSVGCTNRLSKPISVVVPNVDAELTDFFFVKDPNTGSLQPVVKLLNRSNITLTNPIILLDVAGGSGVSQQITGIVKPNQEISQMLDLKLVPKTNQYVCAEVVVAEDSDTFLNRKCLSLSGEEVLFTPFPNPAREQLNLDWISIDGSAVTFQVLTSAGAVSLQQTISSINLGLNRLIINTSALSTGIYFIRFRDGKTDRTFSFAVAGN